MTDIRISFLIDLVGQRPSLYIYEKALALLLGLHLNKWRDGRACVQAGLVGKGQVYAYTKKP